MISAKTFLTDEEKNKVVDTIRKIEAATTGEIRVHIDDACTDDVLDRAVEVFYHLRMDKTVFRNGVLLYIAVKNKQFAIIGDEAINQKVTAKFWKEISFELNNDFKNSAPITAILHALQTIGIQLAHYFPALDILDNNELPNEISF